MKEETKCYCGHTSYCDCEPEEMKQHVEFINANIGEFDKAIELFKQKITPKECMITKIMQMDAKMAYDSLPKQDKIMERFIANAKQETKCYCGHTTYCDCGPETIEDSAKWQQERSYTEEDMAESFMACWKANVPEGFECKLSFQEWLNQFKNK